MREQAFSFESDPSVKLAGTLCLPDDAADRATPGMVLLGGTFGDTRDGDMDAARNPYAGSVPSSGLLRRIAHSLVCHGVASLRYDKRGCGESGGAAELADASADLRDAFAAVRALRARPEIDPDRVGASGHSAGASLVCRIASEDPRLACAGLLGMLFSSLEDLVRWNWGRFAALWPRLTEEQREWLRANREREVVGAFRTEEFIAAARSGQDRVRFDAEGVSFEFDLVRFRQGMDRYRSTPRVEQYRSVRCPALLLHGGEDMNVNVEDALESYRALRQVGNERVELVIIPGLDHNYQVVADDPVRRVWERITFLSQGNVVSPLALDALSSWAERVMVT